MAIAPESLELFKRLLRARALPVCRGRCGHRGAPAGAAADGGQPRPVDMPMDVLLGKPPKMHRDVQDGGAPLPAAGPDRREAAGRRHRRAEPPHGGLQALPHHHRRPHRGRPEPPRPDGRPLAGAGGRLRRDPGRLRRLCRRGHEHGRAHAAGRHQRAGVRPHGGGRGHHQPAGRADRAARVKLSANWMAACGEPGEDAALYATVRPWAWSCARRWASAIPVGKDSLSMRTQWQDGRGRRAEKGHLAGQPDRQRLCHAGRCARHADAAARRHRADTTLVLVDLGRGRNRMGGSILAQTLGRWATTACPTWTTRRTWWAWSRPSTPCAPGPAAGLPRPQRRRPVCGRLRNGLCRPGGRGAECGHAGGGGRRHQRQPHGHRRRQELGGQVQRAARRAHAQGAVQRGAGRGAAGAHGRAQRRSCRPCASTA
jgi:phosphoribosylformylglycinamidine synthase